MHLVTASVALLAIASQALAEPQPYKIQEARMSHNELLGLRVRAEDAGYKPDQTFCTGSGNTCAEACGAGYETCPSNDGKPHCYNPVAKEICCSDQSGNSCDAGYYCTQDSSGGTWCCPDGMTLAQCAAAYSITGSLMSETPAPTTSSTSSTAAYNATTTAPTGTASSYTTSGTAPTGSTSFVPSNGATTNHFNSPAAAVIAIAGAMFALVM